MAAVKLLPSTLNCWETLRWQTKESGQQVKQQQTLLCLSTLSGACWSKPITQTKLPIQLRKQRSP